MDTPKKIGRYEILEELGHGAMGTVYRAKDPAMDRVVALKTIISMVLASEQGSEFRERFYREARAAGGLAHPGIVPVFDVGEHEGLPFLVMEFISGRTLADAVKRGERLSLDRVCEIGQKIAEALGYAHQHGVVHRDIKPANILLTSREAHGIERPKITDFGVAKLAAGQTTLTGQILGTPAYMPPEQFTGASIDGRADIFSLGVVLYWMATGEQPFPGESMTAVSYKVVHTEPVPPRKLNPSIPARLEALILKCLSKSPEDRYQTGDELALELGEIRAGGKGSTLQTAVPQTAAAGSDADATLIDVPPASRATTKTAAPQSVSAAAPAVAAKSKASGGLVLAAIVAAAVLAGGWYMLRNRAKPAVQETAAIAPIPSTPVAATPASAPADTSAAKQAVGESAPATPAAPVRDTPVAAKPAGNTTAKKPDAKVDAKKVEAKADAAAAPKSAAPVSAAATPAAVDFNPKALDPKENAKLKVDAEHMPPGMDFTVEMNGKVYLDSGAEGHQSQYDNLFVPPGVQEFRVTARSGEIQKISNTVSSEFKAKKRNTLKIELRTQGAPSGTGVPQGLYPDTQIVVTLK